MITGAHGFLGNKLLSELQARGIRKLLTPRRAELDLREQTAVRLYLSAEHPDIIIHLAANVGGIGANLRNPGTYFYDNLIMGTILLEEARQIGLQKFVAIGTICSYPKTTPVPFREGDLWIGYPEESNAPYGLAKKMMLVQAQAYRQQFGFNTIYLMPVNLYGPGDNFNLETSHVIPAIIKKIDQAQRLEESEIILWGDGTPTREFLYVDDAVQGIIKATEKYNDSEPVNLGSGSEISIKALAELIAKEMNFKGKIIFDKSKPNGQQRRSLNCSRAYEKFSFKAQTKLEDGLRRTIDWYLSKVSEQEQS
ncbi:MAG: GDP-L-fucose synthase [Candidatus Obscuribacterales bacterium]|nr:GDP-L-fucose synthase [Candidatus Obscuribacterales bacterium]